MLELEGLASGGAHTAWLVHQVLPTTTRVGRYERIGVDADGLRLTPGRIDGDVAKRFEFRVGAGMPSVRWSRDSGEGGRE